MKRIKTCFIVKISQITDSGEMRRRVLRAVELSGYKKKVSLIAHPDDYELICYKSKLDEVIDLELDLNWLIPEGFVEIKEL